MSQTTSASVAPTPTVLVVDDDDFSREVIGEMLKVQGVTDVSCADSANEALNILSGMNSTPDVMICDVFMPDMDGIEFMGALADRHYTGAVVLVSGVDVQMLSLASDIAAGGGILLLGTFTKPLRPDALSAMLAKWRGLSASGPAQIP